MTSSTDENIAALRVISRRTLLSAAAAGTALINMPAAAQPVRSADETRLVSPDGNAVLTLAFDAGAPVWSVQFKEKVVLTPSPLGLVLADGYELGSQTKLIAVERRNYQGRWSPAFGSSATYDESHNEVTLRLEDRARRIRFEIVARAYDQGVAVRYRFIDAPLLPLQVKGEVTAFRFEDAATVWASRDEGEWQHNKPGGLHVVPEPALTESSDRGPYADLPITVDTGNGVFALLTEADRLDYPRLMLRGQGTALIAQLMQYPARAMGWGGPGITPAEPVFTLAAGQSSPWRVLTLAESPAALIETSGVIPSLCEENKLGDVSWVRPGRAFRIRAPYSTEESLVAVDFAEQHKLEYVEYDAHWYGDGTDASDATHPIAGLDLQRVIAYAAERKIGVLLYVDRVPVSRQLEDICRTYQSWGIKGVKFGFVWEGRQSDNAFILNMIETCGAHKLLVCLHDDLRPTGLERTYPNYIALEGVRGNEHFPTARHNTTLPFTRSIAGPLDYTICYANPKNQTTNAHQLAMAAIYYNPLTFLYWYDAPEKYAGKPWPELRWFDECPTTWDETRVIDGKIGEFVLIARRHGSRWFVGAITNEDQRALKLNLDFLGAGNWTAEIFRDGDVTLRAWQTPVVLETHEVTASGTLELVLNSSGGQAILLTPPADT